MTTQTPEHPFAAFIRILGKGKKGSRPLTQYEAYSAMRMILANEVEEIQLGAFLMLMRVKEETAEELAGFVLAIRETLPQVAIGTVDLDWSAYAGKRRHLPWFILSSLLLAENNIKILMHGSSSHAEGRLFVQDVLPQLSISISISHSFDQVEQQLQDKNFAYLSLENLSPVLNKMIHLRSMMGLRSPVHTLVRLINPFNAKYSFQGIFHPSYRPVHQEAALLLKQTHMTVIKGESGETERNPDMECLAQSVHNGVLSEEVWPALFPRRHLKPEKLEPEQLKKIWRGEKHDEFAQASVIGTTAVALRLLAKADSQETAHQLATDYWEQRNKHAY